MRQKASSALAVDCKTMGRVIASCRFLIDFTLWHNYKNCQSLMLCEQCSSYDVRLLCYM